MHFEGPWSQGKELIPSCRRGTQRLVSFRRCTCAQGQPKEKCKVGREKKSAQVPDHSFRIAVLLFPE